VVAEVLEGERAVEHPARVDATGVRAGSADLMRIGVRRDHAHADARADFAHGDGAADSWSACCSGGHA